MQTSGPQPAHSRGLQSHFIPQKTHGESQFTLSSQNKWRRRVKKTEKSKAVNGTTSEPIVPSVRKSRASSCQRCPQREKGEGGTVVRGPARKPSCERSGRSSSTAPRTATKWPRTDPDYRRRGSSVDPKCRVIEQQGVRAESKHVSHSFSNKAFTVIPPNPNKRREIQRKAEAELAALEELRLSRAMAFVSISPSTVGGCMSLEEVRLKQQQEMMQAKRKHKSMMKQRMEQTTVLKS
ncbi:epithelial-stromal interaction protein 1 [Gymnodraco acuticeps]|uniref:Epithelial-stromal interaction protein 1 n=1 Tax=Gymnodraco acuticeps TaxID=8218 RepID=A0A6P8TB68_GYMAC|nr:epithelial-stromal interaction protein 1 [Gymnodraco acuticeps]